MKTRILGKDLAVSEIGLGCMGLSHGYGEYEEDYDNVFGLGIGTDAEGWI